MGPKSHRKTEACLTKGQSTPNTSGYYPVVEQPGTESMNSPDLDERTLHSGPPFEIRILLREQESASVYEIWTEHTVYEFDQSLCCTAVRDARSGAAKSSTCVGSKLIGGRRMRGREVNISSPLPAMGHHALLGDDGHPMTVTTPVTRVIMNLRRWTSTS
jgi:hypothetical protein